MPECSFGGSKERPLGGEVNLIAESAATGLTLGTPLATAVLLAAMRPTYKMPCNLCFLGT